MHAIMIVALLCTAGYVWYRAASEFAEVVIALVVVALCVQSARETRRVRQNVAPAEQRAPRPVGHSAPSVNGDRAYGVLTMAKQSMKALAPGISYRVNGNVLTIEADLSPSRVGAAKPSSTGKSMLVLNSGGWVTLPELPALRFMMQAQSGYTGKAYTRVPGEDAA